MKKEKPYIQNPKRKKRLGFLFCNRYVFKVRQIMIFLFLAIIRESCYHLLINGQKEV